MMLRLVALRGRHLYPSNPTHVATQLQGVRRHFAARKPSQPQPPHRVLQQIPSFSHRGSSIRAFSGTTSASNESAGLLSWYLRMLDKYPLATKSLTAAPIFAFSDITAQSIANWRAPDSGAKEDWDKTRTLRMFGIGMCLSAPALHMWFNIMSRAIPKTDIASALKKVVLGQAIFAPIFNCAFFSVNSFTQGENAQQAMERIKRDLIPTWQSGIIYWPILDFITFRYLPVRLQVLFNNCCSFLWTIYLTSMAVSSAFFWSVTWFLCSYLLTVWWAQKHTLHCTLAGLGFVAGKLGGLVKTYHL